MMQHIDSLDERVESIRSGAVPLPPKEPTPTLTKGNGSKVKSIRKALRKVPTRNWAWVHFYVAFAAWSYVLKLHPPGAVYEIQAHPAVDIWTLITFVGAIAGIIGIFLEAQGKKWVGFGAAFELIGHIGLVIAPLIYGITQIGLLIAAVKNPDMLPPGSGAFDRLHLPFLAYITIAAVAIRAVVVIPRFRKEATDPSKGV